MLPLGVLTVQGNRGQLCYNLVNTAKTHNTKLILQSFPNVCFSEPCVLVPIFVSSNCIELSEIFALGRIKFIAWNEMPFQIVPHLIK